MRPMLGFATGALAAAVSLAACAPIQVHSFADSHADFTLYRTYQWAGDTPRSTGDPRLDNNPFFHERLQRQTDVALAARGYEKIGGGSPDLVLHYHASITQAIDVATTGRSYDVCTDCGAPSVYDAGSIVLDFVDPHTNRLVWRGWAKGSMDGAIDNQALMEQRVDEAVTRVVATVPRR